MWASPTRADHGGGLAAWMRLSAGAKLVTSGKNSTATSLAPFSRMNFCSHLLVIWP